MIELPLIHNGARPPTPLGEWLTSPAGPALRVSAALDQVRRAPTILLAMRRTAELVSLTDDAVGRGVSAGSLLAPILEAIDGPDSVTALAAIQALGRVPGPGADIELAALILEGSPGFEDHALWATVGRAPARELLGPLARAVGRGGLPGMHAQDALARWARTRGRMVLAALESALAEVSSDDARRYLVETIGLIPGPHAAAALEAIAAEPSESLAVRRTAIAAFAERAADPLPQALGRLAHRDDELGESVRLVRAQRRLARRGPRRDDRRSRGIRVAQIHLAAVVDAAGSRAGMGDAGGVSTLLSQLGTILPDQARIAEVISLGRALPDHTGPSTDARPGRRFEAIPLAAGEGATFTGAWPSVVAAARGIRAAFLAGYVPDVVHLRMADPGSLAGALVARELGVPIVFSLAPDPHGPIAAAEAAGTLDRTTFAAADARGALWYRARLVERLASEARELVLFPRARLGQQIRELTGIDIDAGPPRHTVVPEGIDAARADRAARTIREAAAMPPVIAELQRAISALPVERHGLPLVVSIGRLHEAKGMARLVEAFARDAQLAAQANLVIVGGELERPSKAEVEELSRIGHLFERHPGLAQRVVLLGHRPHDDVGLLLATARAGWGALIGAGGAYACGSPKEEFGLAIIEAMAAGLPVVAPRNSGPATYVVNGSTGQLVDTSDAIALGAGVRAALQLATDPATGERTRAIVQARFTLDRMARTLAAVYRIAAGASTLALPVDAGAERAA